MELIRQLFRLFFSNKERVSNTKKIEPTFSIQPEKINLVIKPNISAKESLIANKEFSKNLNNKKILATQKEENVRKKRSSKGIKMMKDRIHQNNVTLRGTAASYCYNSTSSR